MTPERLKDIDYYFHCGECSTFDLQRHGQELLRYVYELQQQMQNIAEMRLRARRIKWKKAQH
jgi:hypothetical protein